MFVVPFIMVFPDFYTEIVDGVDSFNILGEYVLLNRYDSGYSWYIATTDGQICSLDTLMN